MKQKVEELLGDNQVLLFMKGTPEMPRCGFSMRVVGVLEQLGVEYGAVDVLPLLDPLREVTGELADWRTFPQLYVNGELVGGCDIIEEMFESGELAEMVGVEQPAGGEAPPAAYARRPSAEPADADRLIGPNHDPPRIEAPTRGRGANERRPPLHRDHSLSGAT